MESYAEGDLRIAAGTEAGAVILVWSGRGTARHPAATLVPYVCAVVDEAERAGTKRVELDLRQLEYGNSACLGALIASLRMLAERDLETRVVYDGASRWQRKSFAILRVLELQSEGRLRIVSSGASDPVDA